MSTQDNPGNQGEDGDDSSSRPPADDPIDETHLGYEQSDYTAQNIGGRIKDFLSRLNLTDWITAVGTAVIAAATIINVIVVAFQLGEMRSAGIDTHNLAVATSNLVTSAQSQATAMDKLRQAGEAQASAADKLRVAGEHQATATENLANAGRAQASATGSLADNSARQLGAIQASADAAKSQSTAVQEQAKATVTASQSTDRLAQAGQAQANAVVQSLDVARAANDIAARASLAADRPWVSISMPGDIEPVAGQDYKVEFNIANVGRGPALNTTASYDIRIVKINESFNGVIDKCQGACQQYTVFPSGGGFQSGGLTFHPMLNAEIFTADEVKRIADRQDAILLRARMEYLDTSGNVHTTSACSYFAPHLGFTSCSAGNQAN